MKTTKIPVKINWKINETMLSPPPSNPAICGIMNIHFFSEINKVSNKFWVFPRYILQRKFNLLNVKWKLFSVEYKLQKMSALLWCLKKDNISDCQLSRVHVAEDHTSTGNGAWFNFWVRNGIRWVPHPMAGNLHIIHSLAFLMFRLLFRKRIYLELAECCWEGP